MDICIWCVGYALCSALNYWLLARGGAKVVQGWLSMFVIGWLAWDWSSEQIRLFILIMWLVETVVFGIGLFNTPLRLEWLGLLEAHLAKYWLG